MNLNLKQFRINHGLSIMDMAEKIGVNYNTYIFWERNINTPNAINKIKLDEVIAEITKTRK